MSPPPEESGTDSERAAILAGWNPADGPAPFQHSLPPDVDPDLGDNGIAPTDADRVA